MIEKKNFELGPALGKITPAGDYQKLQTWPCLAIVNVKLRALEMIILATNWLGLVWYVCEESSNTTQTEA